MIDDIEAGIFFSLCAIFFLLSIGAYLLFGWAGVAFVHFFPILLFFRYLSFDLSRKIFIKYYANR